MSGYRNKKTREFEWGACVGIATILWKWALIAFPLYLLFRFYKTRFLTLRMLWVSLLGLLTPLWCYAPFWLMANEQYVASLMAGINETL